MNQNVRPKLNEGMTQLINSSSGRTQLHSDVKWPFPWLGMFTVTTGVHWLLELIQVQCV